MIHLKFRKLLAVKCVTVTRSVIIKKVPNCVTPNSMPWRVLSLQTHKLEPGNQLSVSADIIFCPLPESRLQLNVQSLSFQRVLIAVYIIQSSFPFHLGVGCEKHLGCRTLRETQVLRERKKKSNTRDWRFESLARNVSKLDSPCLVYFWY